VSQEKRAHRVRITFLHEGMCAQEADARRMVEKWNRRCLRGAQWTR